jgi:hypothetical protein
VRDFGERAPFLHMKDGAAVKGSKIYNSVPMGEGPLNFLLIVKASGKNIK